MFMGEVGSSAEWMQYYILFDRQTTIANVFKKNDGYKLFMHNKYDAKKKRSNENGKQRHMQNKRE